MKRAGSGTFDPYHQWLGIPPGRRPPTLYQLLGLQVGENDESVIEAAAVRQTAFVAGFRNGPQGAQAIRLLSEIEQARFTLLDPVARKKYGAALKAKARQGNGRIADGTLPPRSGGRSVGEESGLAREFSRIMAVIIAGFLVMLTATFYFWDRSKTPKTPTPAAAAPALLPVVANPLVPADEPVPLPPAPPIAEATPDPVKPDDWHLLFNGRDLAGWRFKVPPAFIRRPLADCWSAKGNVFAARRNGHNWIESERQTYGDFVLSLEWRFPAGEEVTANGGGVVVRASGLNGLKLDPAGIEVDLRPIVSSTKGTGNLIAYDTRATNPTGSTNGHDTGRDDRHLEWLTEPKVDLHGGWNTCVITCQGDRLTVEMNGQLVNQAWGLDRPTGAICLRSQDSAVEYRNVRIRELEANGSKPNAQPSPANAME